MTLPEICIKRPVFATVLSLILVVIGIMGFHYLNTRFFPKFAQNSILITTTYSGASAKLIENSITTPLEKAISGMQGIDTMVSVSEQGMSSITVKLKDGFNLYRISNKIRNKIALASYQLPTGVRSPTVQAGWGSMELMDIGFTDSAMNLAALRDYINRFVINKLQEIPGIADVEIDGSNKYAMRIWLDPQKMESHHLSVNDISTAITNNNIQLPAGSIKGNQMDFPITAATKLHSASQFGNIILQSNQNQMIRLKDVATVALGTDNQSQVIVKINGQPGINLTIYTNTNANPIQAAKAVHKTLETIKRQLPPSMTITPTFNQATFMKASVHEVYIAIGIAILCVIFIIFIFLGKLRNVLIPIVTIPICLIASFGLMYFLGFSINVITLLALVLSIGLVVDDAIVMLENIYRHIESGMKPYLAAIKGSREITFAVIAMTITLAAVYMPIGLVKGKAANIFQSFAFTLAGTVLISGFIALTLSPMMCSRLLGNTSKQSHYEHGLHRFLNALTNSYQKLLGYILKFRWLIILITFSIGVGGYFLLTDLPKAFMPHEDIGFVLAFFHHNSGTNANTIEQEVGQVSRIMRSNPNVENTSSFASESENGFNMVLGMLKPYSQRKENAKSIAESITKKVKHYPGISTSIFAPSFGGSMRHQLEFTIMGTGSYRDIYHISQSIMAHLKKYPGLKYVHSSMNFDSQQYKLTVNRNLAARAQISVSTIDQTLATLLGGSAISTFSMGGENYDVYLQAQKQYRRNINSIEQFQVKN